MQARKNKQSYIWGISLVLAILIILLWLVLTRQPENYGLMAFFIIIIALIMAVNSYRIIKYNSHASHSVQARTYRRSTYRPSQQNVEVCYDFYAYCPNCGLIRKEGVFICGRCQSQLPIKELKDE